MKPTQAMIDLLKKAGSSNLRVAEPALAELAVALTTPLKEGVLKGDITGDLFTTEFFAPGVATEYPLDFLTPGSEGDFSAYTIPNQGRIPERHVDGDYLMVPTYLIGNSIDTATRYLRDARWDVLGRMLQVLEAGFVRKRNTDAWRTLLYAAVNRGLTTYDSAATAGLLSKRLISLMKLLMRRNAGGNSTSVDRISLTDVFLSPEALEDIRAWDLDDVDEVTRRQIFIADEYGLTRIFGVNLHDLDELGVGQEFQTYITTTLGLPIPGSKEEWVVGVDRPFGKAKSFVHPVREEMQLFEDTSMHRSRRVSFYGTEESGWGVCDDRALLLGAL